MLAKQLSGAAAAVEPAFIEDTFSTYLYTGNGSTQTITNGIDLSGEGGLVWIKGRDSAYGHRLTDTVRGATNSLESNSTTAQATESAGLTAFGNTGFTIGTDVDYNFSSAKYVSWTFRKAPKFFDVVTWTGNGADQTISHNLGSTPGCIIVKRTDTTGDWYVYHRSLSTPSENWILLNITGAANGAIGQDLWGPPTSTTFKVDTYLGLSTSGATYVAYLFAHDAGGFGLTGTDNVISCGSFTTNGSGNATVNLGYEPQWLIIKRSDGTMGWQMVNNMTGLSLTSTAWHWANLANAESSISNYEDILPSSTGFYIKNAGGQLALNATYIYIAIRRGPMLVPTSGTQVFNPVVYTGTNVDNRLVNTTIAPDMVWVRERNDTTPTGMVVGDRLRGNPYLWTGATSAENTDADSLMTPTVGYGNAFSAMNGFGVGNDTTSNVNADTTSNNHIALAFKRAPGFFDVVCDTGTGSAHTITHNLGAVPELMIRKKRGAIDGWIVYANNDNTDYLILNSSAATADDNTMWNDTSPTSSVFTVGTNDDVNGSGATFVTYLFATVSGVSKVGSYTGTGTTKQIDCGFTGGARFVLIKRTDSAGAWYVWDTARGIVAGNDPYLLLNSTAAEVTSNDYVDTYSAGFEISSTAPATINANGGTFIFLAVS